MKIPSITVEINRSLQSKDLTAHVIQEAADGPKRGSNILMRRHIRRIETAKKQVIAQLIGIDSVLFSVKASPDWKRPQTVLAE